MFKENDLVTLYLKGCA